ncbi:MAG: nucleotidyltransferase family protein [Myxococcota bacterium]
MSRVAALLLAAGGSRRMGRLKQLLRFEGSSLVRRAARAALDSRCAELVVVVGADARDVRETLAGLPLRIVSNPDWQEGIASSLRAGIDSLDDDVDGVLVLLADQIRVDASLIDALLATWEDSGLGMAACQYPGGPGPPALFARRHFEALGALSGDRGAKGLLLAQPQDCVLVDAPQAAFDVDSPEDLESLRPR